MSHYPEQLMQSIVEEDYLGVDFTEVNDHAIKLGREIFAMTKRGRPSIFDQRFWSGEIMEWSMKNPAFKLNMFRLVDVLPTLRTNEAISKHLSEYLAAVAGNISALLKWLVDIDPTSFRSPVAGSITKFAVEQMAKQFIAGQDPESALPTLRKIRANGGAFTVDLLGEYSLSEKEALIYVDRYLDALKVFSKFVPYWPEGKPLLVGHPGERSSVCISVKLTTLYSQCGPLNVSKSVSVLAERLFKIARKAREVNALMYVDAEDSGNNEIIYKTFAKVFGDSEFRDFPYPGIVVQAYSKNSEAIIDELITFARLRGSPISIRLVKGAYWDHETVSCDQNGWECPLFRIKESSDANYEALSRKLLDNCDAVLPAFGSHNVRSLAYACAYAEKIGRSKNNFELQMLYGMADPIANAFVKKGYLVRFYTPLGEMLPGMGYLIRRLLENTSNESFLRHTFFEDEEVEALLREPQMREATAVLATT